MKRCIFLLLLMVLLVMPKNAEAEVDDYKVVSELPEENISLYAKEINGFFRDFKMYFKGETYFRPFWMNVTNPTYAPELFYEDINQDGT